MFESERALKPTEQAPIFIDEKTKPQRRPVTHQVSLKLESLNSISGLLDQCSLGPRPLMCPPSAMAKPLVVCPRPGHAPCLHPYGSLCVQPNHRWVNLHVHELRLLHTSLPSVCCTPCLGCVLLPIPNL